MDIQKIIVENNLKDLFYNGGFGIEKESIRVNKKTDMLADTDHPATLAEREQHPYIQTDYGEAQPELITPPFSSITQSLNFLKGVNEALTRALPKDEYIWPFSIPSRLPEDHLIRISETGTEEVKEYREYTGEKYGRSRQLMSGLHLNFSFSEEFVEKLYENQDKYDSIMNLKNALYLKTSRNFLRYEWVLIYLFGATPVAEEEFFRQNKAVNDSNIPTRPMRSIRNSTLGYYNETDVTVRYDDLESYIFDIEDSVLNKRLKEEREYYGDVRLKGGMSKRIQDLLQSGIEYIELRSLDLNPMSPLGMTNEEATFIHLFILYLAWIDEIVSEIEIANEGKDRLIQTAEEYPLDESAFKDDAKVFIAGMKDMLEDIDKTEFIPLVDKIINLFDHPEKTVSGYITKVLNNGESFIDLGHRLGMMYKTNIENKAFELDGFDSIKPKEQNEILQAIKDGMSWDDLQALVYKED